MQTWDRRDTEIDFFWNPVLCQIDIFEQPRPPLSRELV